jgi:CheY-like chemotaxis protein
MVIRQMKRFIAHLNAEIKPLRSISALEGCDLLVVDWRRASIAPQAERYQKELLKIGELGTVKRVVLIRNSPRTASSISKDLCDVAVTIPLKKSVFLEALGVEKQEEPKKPTLEIPRELADSVRVLIVEDNATNQTVIKSQLQALGISSNSSLDGTQAIKATLDVEYDIVLMDIHMPVMDGITATKTIRARTGHQPIIVGITASTEATERELALESGMDMLVSKPFKLAELRSILMKYMPNLPPALPSK